MSWRHKEDRSIPQKTSFSNISAISSGFLHSLLQNDKGEIFSCGYNRAGECPQITPSLILNTPPNIVQFRCGGYHSLFLGSEGNVYSVGQNFYGELGLGNKTNQKVLNKIPNIPPIKLISCARSSCYLIDFEGNLWTFGRNDFGQLGHGDRNDINAPKIINTLKDIQQISHGCCGTHFFAKNSQNQIFVTGNNYCGQLGAGDSKSFSIPEEINSQYSAIWGYARIHNSRAKSARK